MYRMYDVRPEQRDNYFVRTYAPDMWVKVAFISCICGRHKPCCMPSSLLLHSMHLSARLASHLDSCISPCCVPTSAHTVSLPHSLLSAPHKLSPSHRPEDLSLIASDCTRSHLPHSSTSSAHSFLRLSHRPEKIEMSFNLSTYQPHLKEVSGLLQLCSCMTSDSEACACCVTFRVADRSWMSANPCWPVQNTPQSLPGRVRHDMGQDQACSEYN